MWLFPNIRIVKRRARRSRKASAAERAHYLHYKERARECVTERVHHWNQHYHVQFGRISIRNQRSRWGSCSTKGNLNFNYRIVFLPERLIDYVVVHELCHLLEFNHSAQFWSHVERTMPDYVAHKKELLLQQNALPQSLS